MRRKLQRLFRYNTEELSPEDKIEPKNQSRLSNALSINKFNHTNRHSQIIEPFNEKNINLTSCVFKSKSNFRVVHYQNLKSNRNLRTTKLELQQSTKSKKITKEEQRINFCNIFKEQIRVYQGSETKGAQMIEKVIQIMDQISQQIYFYVKVQGFIKLLNSTIKNIGCKSLIFMCYCFSAQCLYIYGSYSLSIFYSDKALKLLGEKLRASIQEKQAQLQIYRTITKIFLIKNKFDIAKNFGYKFLRKSWMLDNFQKELDAYDLIGKIYHECQQKAMSKYFHEKMCKGQRQNSEIIKISNYQLEKIQKNIPQFAVYETIEVFIQRDRSFHEMLQDRYRMKNKSSQIDICQNKTQFFFHTNRSPNRNLDTYRNLQRKMIEEKKSKELHFIKPKQKGNLKKYISVFQKLLIQAKIQFQSESENTVKFKQ